MNRNSAIYYFISVISHVMIVLAAVLMLDFSSETSVMGVQTEQRIQSYLYKDVSHHTSEMQNKSITKTVSSKKETVISTKKIVKHTESLKNKSIALAETEKTISQPSASSSSSNGVQVDELLAVLHTAIQQQQHYPESALQMERQGRATMTFTLFPDGKIQNLRVSKSSGTESLDGAALAAVSNAAPFNHVDRYLDASKEFSIDVVFDLS